jgi:hypothetical protein
MVAAFCAPVFIPDDTTSVYSYLSDEQNVTSTGNYTYYAAVALQGICDVVADDVGKDYIDPVAGLTTVILAAASLTLYQVLKYCKPKKPKPSRKSDEKETPVLGSKSVRALNLLVQLLCASFILGHYLVWSDWRRPQGGVLCRVFGRVTLAIFYKPLVPAMWYGVAHLLDDEGCMLHHNIFTDTLVFGVMGLFGLWWVFTFAVGIPIMVLYPVQSVLLALPMSIFDRVNGVVGFREKRYSSKYSFRGNLDELSGETIPVYLEENDFFKFLPHEFMLFLTKTVLPHREIYPTHSELVRMNEDEREEATAAKTLYKRLQMYTWFTVTVYAVVYWPYLLGENYTIVQTKHSELVGINLSFWTPEFFFSFDWPFNIQMPVQIALTVSLGAIGLEQAVFAWNYLYYRVYAPRGASAYGGRTIGKTRNAGPPEDEDLKNGRSCDFGFEFSVDAGDGSAAIDVTASAGGEQTSVGATFSVETGDGEVEHGGGEGEGEPLSMNRLELVLGRVASQSWNIETDPVPTLEARIACLEEECRQKTAAEQGNRQKIAVLEEENRQLQANSGCLPLHFPR